MLKLALTFVIVALVFALLGFGGIAGALVDIAIILFWVALAIALVLFVLGFLGARKMGGR